MKAVILAGGLGSRISEESDFRPKPMIEVGGIPVLIHLMRYLSSFGINDFVVLVGYKSYVIKEYFSNYMLHQSDCVFDFANSSVEFIRSNVETWKITLLDTGVDTLTGSRLKNFLDRFPQNEEFLFTYGDGLADVDIGELLNFHRSSGKLATVTGVRAPVRFGRIVEKNNVVVDFREKVTGDDGFINGGFFILNPGVGKFIPDNNCAWESEPLSSLVAHGEVGVFKHRGFWYAMDTLRDQRYLDGLVRNGDAPWLI